MVTSEFPSTKRPGFAMAEMMLAILILVLTVIPLGFSINADARAFKAAYQKAVAMEIVDGEMEILAAGAWRAAPEGAHPYAVRAAAASNLPPGTFTLTRNGGRLRLEWSSTKNSGVGVVAREAQVK